MQREHNRPNSLVVCVPSGTARDERGGWPRRLAWAALALSPVLLLGVFVSLAQWRGDVEWGRLRAEAAVVQAEFEARDPARPVLWGAATEGNAWPEYWWAFERLPGMPHSGYVACLGRIAGASLAGVTFAEPEQAGPSASEVLAGHAEAFAALRAGAHMAEARREIHWTAGFDQRVVEVVRSRQLAEACVLAAFAAVRDDDGGEAVRLLLDALQLGRDLAQSPLRFEQVLGYSVLWRAGNSALASSNLLRKLDAGALESLAVGLARLDGAMPLDSRWIASEAVLFAHHPWAAAGVDSFAVLADLDWRVAWEHGGSTQLALAEHGVAQLDLAARVRVHCLRGDSVDLPALQRLLPERGGSPNPLTGQVNPDLRHLQYRLDSIARLRLLRMAVQHASGVAVEPLPDPSGGHLQWGVDPDGVAEFWSAVGDKRTSFRLPR